MTKSDKAILAALETGSKWRERFWKRTKPKATGCIEWTGAVGDRGYGILQIEVAGSYPSVRSHRLAWALHNNQPIPKGLVVCHRCDNPLCVNPAHLFIGHQKDNVADMMSKGRGRQGVHWYRIPAETVDAIRSDKGTPKELSLKYGVSLNHTYNILAGRRRAAA